MPLTAAKPEKIHADFILSENGETVISCPAGNTPPKNSYYEKTGMCCAVFEPECCETCPFREECGAKLQKKSAVVQISTKMVRRSQYFKELSTEAFKEFTKQCNAVEGIPSVLRRKYDVDDIPVRGLLRSKVLFGLKIGAINIIKVLKHYLPSKDFCKYTFGN